MKTIGDHLHNYEEYLVLKNFSEATIRSYLQRLKSFLEYRKTQGLRGRMSQHQARLYILYRTEQGVMWSTVYSGVSMPLFPEQGMPLV